MMQDHKIYVGDYGVQWGQLRVNNVDALILRIFLFKQLSKQDLSSFFRKLWSSSHFLLFWRFCQMYLDINEIIFIYFTSTTRRISRKSC